MMEYDWNFSCNGNRVTVTSPTDGEGRRSPISKVLITSVKNLQSEEFPTIIASGGVTVQRETDPPAKKA